ncbi:hypothetical protein GCM10023350_06340 [Nocardioides endophyticus]|uniref:Toxin-antitoxin system HicB family antitoxin n=1 Tax=Nocardioides endophyticus TaxID=1353775 RepID=A0ABP8YDH2_9ACTN
MSRPDPRKGVAGKTHDRGANPVRGVRVDLELWEAAAERAAGDGINRNAAIVALLRGYVAGSIHLPKT